jgi:hypothetical protein
MSVQKYRRTNFEDDDNSLVDTSAVSEAGTPTGGAEISTYETTVSYSPVNGTALCWRRRTHTERLLLAVTACLLLVVAVMTVMLSSQQQPLPLRSNASSQMPPVSGQYVFCFLQCHFLSCCSTLTITQMLHLEGLLETRNVCVFHSFAVL